MPTEIRVVDFSDQTGLDFAAATANLLAEDPAVLIVIDRVNDPVVPTGIVISQTVANINPELVGGPAGSAGVRVTLTVSAGRGTWFDSAVNEAEASKRRFNPFLAADFDFPSGHVRLWSGWGVIQIGGEDYLGMGELVRVSSVAERSNMTTERKTYQLSGAMVDPAAVSEADIDASFGRPIIEYLGFLDPKTRRPVAEPEIRWEGEISNIRRVDGREPLIEVNADDRLAMLDKVDGWRYTHEHQQQFYAGDMGCEPAARLDQRDVLWGGHRVGAGVGTYTGGGGGRNHNQRP